MGAIISRDRAAYTYLPESTKTFPRPPRLREIMQAAGIGDVSWKMYGGGIVALHSGVLPLHATPASGATTAQRDEVAGPA